MKYLRHYHMKVAPPICTSQVDEMANYQSDFLPAVGDYCTVGKSRYRVMRVYEPYPAMYSKEYLYHVHIEIAKE